MSQTIKDLCKEIDKLVESNSFEDIMDTVEQYKSNDWSMYTKVSKKNIQVLKYTVL